MTNDERRFVIDLMTWSFSRLNSFYGCRYEWLQKYIEEPRENNLDSCYGQGGGFAHELLEGYFKGELDAWDLPSIYETEFNDKVTEWFPTINGKNLRDDYYEKILDYFNNFEPLPDEYEILGVEKKVEFEIDGYPFIGFIDLLLRDKTTGQITILDHKSSSMKYKKNGDFAKASQPKFLEYKRQLYLYSIPIIEEYGKVDWLEWNFFKDGKMVGIPWKREEYEEAKKWAVDTIHEIENETEWPMKEKTDFMYCSYLCSKRGVCPLKQQEKAEREFVPE